MRASVLVIGDAIVETGKGELFHCLAGNAFERVYHVGFKDALEQYTETVDDRWDIVIVDGGLDAGSAHLTQQLYDVNEGQQIIVVDERCEVRSKTAYGMIVPRNADMLEEALRELGVAIAE